MSRPLFWERRRLVIARNRNAPARAARLRAPNVNRLRMLGRFVADDSHPATDVRRHSPSNTREMVHGGPMRAVVLRDGDLSVRNIADPEPGPGELLCRTLATGPIGQEALEGRSVMSTHRPRRSCAYAHARKEMLSE